MYSAARSAARFEENRPRAPPPDASHSSRRRSADPHAHQIRRFQSPGNGHNALLCGSRKANLRRCSSSAARLALQSQGGGNIKRVTTVGRTRQNHGAASEQSATQLQTDAQRGDVQGRRVGIGSSNVAAVLPATLTRILARPAQQMPPECGYSYRAPRDTRASAPSAGQRQRPDRPVWYRTGRRAASFTAEIAVKADRPGPSTGPQQDPESSLPGCRQLFPVRRNQPSNAFHATCRTANHRNRQEPDTSPVTRFTKLMSLINTDRLMPVEPSGLQSVNRRRAWFVMTMSASAARLRAICQHFPPAGSGGPDTGALTDT